MKQVIMWALIFLVLFIVFIGLAFVGLTMMTPDPAELEQAANKQVNEAPAETQPETKSETQPETHPEVPGVEQNPSNPETPETAKSDSTETIETEVSETDSLRQANADLTSDLFFSRVAIDSLNNELENKETLIAAHTAEIEALEKSVENLKQKNINIKDLAKTYETMKVTEIRPILEKVDDETVIALYKNMGSRTKKNLIQALSGVRAARITQILAGT